MISKSATSRALTCADIIVEMIKQTALPLDGPLTSLYHKYDRPLLSTLALVSKAFNGPATKALWSRLDSFLPVLNVLTAFDSSSPGTTPTYVRRRFLEYIYICQSISELLINPKS